MYTRCPDCRIAYRIDAKQLRDGQGEVLCERCGTRFNALESLSTTVKESQVAGDAKLVDTPVLGERAAVVVPRFERDRLRELDGADAGMRSGSGATARFGGRGAKPAKPLFDREKLAWAGGALALALLLLGQVLAFEGRRLAQNATVRPLLDGLCSVLGCELPPFRDAGSLKITDRLLSMAGGPRGGFQFSLVLVNLSDLPQAYPRLRLELNDLSGRPAAERSFDPIEYLPDWHLGRTMPVGEPVEVILDLARPSREISGFTIQFR